MTDWIETFTDTLAKEGQSPWLCSMATVDNNGRPTIRTMLCREVNDDGELVFVSDRRTRKDSHLRERPACEVVFWLPNPRVQFRVTGEASVMGPEADQFKRQRWWDTISDESRALFVSPKAWAVPEGSPKAVSADTPMPGTFELLIVTPSEVEMRQLADVPREPVVWKA